MFGIAHALYQFQLLTPFVKIPPAAVTDMASQLEGSGTKVILVGAGIAGPVLATFLKLKGYEPVLYERTTGLTDTGVAHWYVLQASNSSRLS